MHPRDFQRSRAVIGGLLKSGTPFNSLPWLDLQMKDDGPTVSVEARQLLSPPQQSDAFTRP